jgi:hypothetical protein
MSVRAIAVAAAVCCTALAVAASAGGAAFWRAFLSAGTPPAPDRGLVLTGGDGGSLPRATAEEQGLDETALLSAGQTAQSLGAAAFVVVRRGHLVHEQLAAGGDARQHSLLLARLVLGAGVAASQGSEQVGAVVEWSRQVQGNGSLRNPWSSRSQANFGSAPAALPGAVAAPRALAAVIDAQLWRPLSAAPATYAIDGAGEPRLHCCLWLQARDAAALASALLNGGQVGGEHLLSASAAGELLTVLDDGVPPRGAEPFGARTAQVLRDDQGTRLYFFPAEDLVILLVGADERRLTDETEIAHQVLRGIVDRVAPAASPATGELVPKH